MPGNRSKESKKGSKRWQDGALIEPRPIVGYLQGYDDLFARAEHWVSESASSRLARSLVKRPDNPDRLPVTLGKINRVYKKEGAEQLLNRGALPQLQKSYNLSRALLTKIQNFTDRLHFEPKQMVLRRDYEGKTVFGLLIIGPGELHLFDTLRETSQAYDGFVLSGIGKQDNVHYLSTPVAKLEDGFLPEMPQLEIPKLVGRVAIMGGAVLSERPSRGSVSA